MSLGPRYTCSVCDGSLYGGPANGRCWCETGKKPRPTFVAWYLRGNPHLVERIEEGTAPDTGWPRVAA